MASCQYLPSGIRERHSVLSSNGCPYEGPLKASLARMHASARSKEGQMRPLRSKMAEFMQWAVGLGQISTFRAICRPGKGK